MNGIHRAERAEAVPAGTLERDAEARASDRDVRDAEPVAVDRHEPIDPVLQRFVEQPLDAAQIAETFFADRANERDRAWRRHAALFSARATAISVGQPAAVVADARPAQEHSPGGGP